MAMNTYTNKKERSQIKSDIILQGNKKKKKNKVSPELVERRK